MRLVRESDRLAGRLDPDLPMLVLSGRAGELDRLRGFGRGADDYLVKPFSYTELHARVGALLRRSSRRGGTGRMRIGALELDAVSRQAWLYGKSVHLSKKEYALLRALAAEPTRVFTREELLRGVWGFRTLGETRTLDSHAARLRKKLSARGDRFVINVWGVGYRLVDGSVE
jgi:DNA-binding response OmpR family regulator